MFCRKHRFSRSPRVSKGLTLIELLVAMFVITVIMTSLAAFFSSSVSSHKIARDKERYLETSQEALNIMAKSMRGSSLVSCNPNCTGGQANAIRIYNYSLGRCERYGFENGSIKYRYVLTDRSGCTPGTTLGSEVSLATSIITNGSKFFVKQSSNGVHAGLGYITVILQTGSSTDNNTLQTTVSLRDYESADFNN